MSMPRKEKVMKMATENDEDNTSVGSDPAVPAKATDSPTTEEEKLKLEVSQPNFPCENLPEVWLNVFEKLDAKDKIAFAKASTKWHDVVAPKRTSTLFKDVFPKN